MTKPGRPTKSPTNTQLAGARPAPPDTNALTSPSTSAPPPPDTNLFENATIVQKDSFTHVVEKHPPPTPPAKRPIIQCSECFFGAGPRIDGRRVCRARRPDASVRSQQVVIGRGSRPLASAVLPEVDDNEWCGDGTLDGWPVKPATRP